MFNCVSRFYFLLSCWILVGSVLHATPSLAESRTLNDKVFEVVGVRIAKSGSMQLADLSNGGYKALRQSTYIPAGTPLLLLNHEEKDAERRSRTLAITSTGLLIYARTDGTHFFSPEEATRWVQQNGEIAIAQSKFEVPTLHYGVITVTPTEVYAFRSPPGEEIEIRVGKDKMGDLYSEDEYVKVSPDNFEIIGADQLASNAIPDPFQIYDAIADLQKILENAVSLNLTKEDQEKIIRTLQNGRLVDQKSCNDNVDISMEANAGIEFDTDSMFSPLKAKLGISGKYASSTKFPEGTEFSLTRYARGEDVVEFKQEQIYGKEGCRDPLERQRLIVGEAGDKNAEIDSAIVKQLGLPLTSNFLPEYRCRDEYMKLIDFLTRQEELSYDTAVLAIARFARYQMPKNAASCVN